MIVNRAKLFAILGVPLLAGLALLALPAVLLPHQPVLKMTVIDVGQGDSILLETPSGRTMLIDGGGVSDTEEPTPGDDVGERVVVPFLRHEGLHRIDVVVVTHPHGDHVGGLPSVFRAFPVGKVLDGTVLPYNTDAYNALLAIEQAHHVQVVPARRGMTIDMGDGVTMVCLNPPPAGTPYGTEPNNTVMNDYSAVLRLTYRRVHILLDGDAQTEAEQSMLAAYPGQLSADVLKCGHHGAANATTDPWLDAVRPTYAIISCGLHNHYGHPSPLTLARLAAHHVHAYVTAYNGAVTVTTDGETVHVTAEKSAPSTLPGTQ